MSGELLSVAPHLISDTVYTVNTDFCLQWLQLLDNHVTATETDAVPLVSHSVTCFTQCHFTLKPSRHFGLLSPYSRPTLSRKNSMRFLQIIRINR